MASDRGLRKTLALASSCMQRALCEDFPPFILLCRLLTIRCVRLKRVKQDARSRPHNHNSHLILNYKMHMSAVQRIGGEVYKDMRRAQFIGAFKRAVVAHKIFDANVHNFTMHAFSKFSTDIDRFYCQPCASAWGWEEVDQLDVQGLVTGIETPSRRAVSPHPFGCCEKSALNRGIFANVEGLSQIGQCFRDWETPSSNIPRYHIKMPIAE